MRNVCQRELDRFSRFKGPVKALWLQKCASSNVYPLTKTWRAHWAQNIVWIRSDLSLRLPETIRDYQRLSDQIYLWDYQTWFCFPIFRIVMNTTHLDLSSLFRVMLISWTSSYFIFQCTPLGQHLIDFVLCGTLYHSGKRTYLYCMESHCNQTVVVCSY